jgi:serine/threonine protein kinase
MDRDPPLTPPHKTPRPVPGIDLFGHFQVYRRPDHSLLILGQGAMGVTYRARDTRLDRDVALKVISPHLIGNAKARDRFLRESKAAALAQHPHLASVIFQGEEAGICFYAMELIDGETLESYVHRTGPLPARPALELARQLVQALDAAHRHHLIHGDLKPGNIMLTSYQRTGDLHAKIIDFGLARSLHHSSDTPISSEGILGTPGFASPEVWEESALDCRSDLYSLGATLWFMVTAEPPFEGTPRSVLQAQAGAEPPLEKLAQQPWPIRSLLEKLMARRPADRPAQPHDAEKAIEQALLDLPEEPTPTPRILQPTRVLPDRAPSPRHEIPPPFPKQALLAAGSLVLFLLFIIAILIFRPKDTPPTSAPTTFTNSIAQTYLTVPGLTGMVSAWETQVRDYQAFINDTGDPDAISLPPEFLKWDQPGFPQNPSHPVVHVSPEDANRFARWLTRRERLLGLITPQQEYRLPTRNEFEIFSGLQASGRPGLKPTVYPWGDFWPPHPGSGNFADESALAAASAFFIIEEYDDGFPYTAPGGRALPLPNGLYDVGGNVWEITQDIKEGWTEYYRQGGGWTSYQPTQLKLETKIPLAPTESGGDLGFRLILAPTSDPNH